MAINLLYADKADMPMGIKHTHSLPNQTVLCFGLFDRIIAAKFIKEEGL
jgi:hypothetical protein